MRVIDRPPEIRAGREIDRAAATSPCAAEHHGKALDAILAACGGTWPNGSHGRE
jgi:hypothetical protein